MRTLITASCTALLLLTTQTAHAGQAVPAAAAPDTYQCLLDTAAKPPVPGALMEVRGPGVRFAGASGVFRVGGRKLKVADPFRTASVTKTMTAATALRLVEQGSLDVDAPVSRYLPAKLVARLPHGAQITVKQLITHTSGLVDYVGDDWIAYVVKHPHKTWKPVELVEWAIAHGKPYGRPGAVYHYSDTGYTLLGMVMEAASGKPLHRLYRTLLLNPLGMRDTYLEWWERSRGAVAHSYLGDVDLHGFNPTFDTFGGGGLVSTAADLTRFVRALFEGKVFDRPETLEAMMTVTPQSRKAGEPYGMGVEALSIGKETVWGHGGHLGAFQYYSVQKKVSVTGTLTQDLTVSMKQWEQLVGRSFLRAFGTEVPCP
ncbi:serine hydrolase domain-containing protein [Nonomuraea sp. NPDC050556]|uniref:serine hydrolase domain-containing protein n=1 Tax=Nonomuraea sp. NPDC050556 TaxID=3364369 RepID=UPI0037B5753A